ncbi:MAG TPA: nucleoside 2-deoxyribosyltransferase, partial [Patescibacteria group bacterium]|nr:nucleoside 2-deoxyribosyltransferase [Patescibacteria group bacterium]
MKIYFAGSITGGRDDQGLYLEIIDLLKNYGEVLTEHIGSSNISDQGEQVSMSGEDIFNRDVAWLEQAEVIVAEVTVISLGVGYELGIAEKLG